DSGAASPSPPLQAASSTIRVEIASKRAFMSIPLSLATPVRWLAQESLRRHDPDQVLTVGAWSRLPLSPVHRAPASIPMVMDRGLYPGGATTSTVLWPPNPNE